ncbi:MAG TPA: lytic murein transglycosylase [Solirubrobacteraceae bacterium]
MTKRKLLIGCVVVALLTAWSGALLSPSPASAQARTLLVTLVGGTQLTLTVDVPPGTPVNQITIPGLPAPILSIQDISGPTAPASAPATNSGAPTTTTPGPAPLATPDSPLAAPDGSHGQQAPERTTGSAKHKAQGQGQSATDQSANADANGSNKKPANRARGGAPTSANPTFSLALPGPAPIGVPNFFIEKFRIPPFLLPIYQAAGIQYGIRWEVLAAINEIETDYGRNLNVSTAGAVGWMQFLPSTWKRYGVDANGDGTKDPYNPVDAIFAAARYLRAAGGDKSVTKAIFSYNHADWYVQSVLLRARLIGGLPADFVGSLTGLTEGHFPVHARATYADDISEKALNRRIARGHNAAIPVASSATRRSINIYAKPGSPAIAVQDGTIVSMGKSKRLGNFVKLRDVYGNTYTYAGLRKLAAEYPVPKPKKVSKAAVKRELSLPKRDPRPASPATAGRQKVALANFHTAKPKKAPAATTRAPRTGPRVSSRPRLFANPARPAAFQAGGRDQILNAGGAVPGLTTFRSYFTQVFGLKRSDVYLKRLQPGSKVIGGTILGRIGRVDRTSPHVVFYIRPAGRGAPQIDPKPILDGWKLLESTAIYRAAGKNPFFGANAKDPTIGQVLLMSKEALAQRVLTDPRVSIYSCGQRDIKAGVVDRRVLAVIEFLSASGLRPTITSLRCGHSFLTTSGNVSEHSTGDATDIAKVNGIPIAGHQGRGSITDITIRRLLTLQGTMKPHQIISLMTYPNADNTLALPDHWDHIHVGFHPLVSGKDARKFASVLRPGQWIKLIDRLNHLDNPTVPVKPSKYAVRVTPPTRASAAHAGE